MKAVNKPNLAFKNQPKPLEAKRITQAIKTLRPKTPPLVAAVDVSLGIAGTTRTEIILANASYGIAGRPIRARAKNVKIGQHSFPPDIPVKLIKTRGNKSPKFRRALLSTGFLPPHLARTLRPKRVPKALKRQFRRFEGSYAPGGSIATTIFPPDDRREFFDTSYPWSCCGRMDANGQGSGVMVGPRHMLTVSHGMQWNRDGTAGPVQFRPMLFDTSAPFGEAWGIHVYFKRKISDETLGWIDEQYDYVVVVLDRRIGDTTGWMGAKGYTDAWDHGHFWAHVGYPGDLNSSMRPTFQGQIALDGIWYELDSHEAMSHSADVFPGQSGGPFFGWWAGDSFPSVVAVQSTQNSSENKASGGQDLVDLILRARKDFP